MAHHGIFDGDAICAEHSAGAASDVESGGDIVAFGEADLF